jgi:acyl-CoA synthetase (AMP-forming)/AMP-acid ligase II/acyl carrier protein/1-acyl-sn-glycerol-3-phosphate acyltransferase
MLDWLVTTITKIVLWLRYDIRIDGLDKIAAKGKTGIVFLPNHPALIDPVMLYTYLQRRFAPRGFGDQDQVDRFFIRFFAKRWGVRTIPSIEKYGPAVQAKVEEVLDESIEDLKTGGNLIIWPAGRIYRSHTESLGANSSVERIIQRCPNIRIILIRTTGLWGSAFSWAGGYGPKVAPILRKGFLAILTNGIFFTPRRKVTIEFYEPLDLPRSADRNTFNRVLEKFYNAESPPNTYVPYTIWEKGRVRTLPEPAPRRLESDYSLVPQTTRQIVLKHLTEVTSVSQLKDTDRLASDLGMDSLARTDLLLWLEKEFGIRQPDADAMQTVGDVMLAGCGKFVYVTSLSLKTVAPCWFKKRIGRRVSIPEGDTVTGVFLKQASRHPDTVAFADQSSGVKTYRDIVAACMVLKSVIEGLEGEYIGIMLPASVAADIFYLATLFAGKTPVMVNWTAGERNTRSSLDSVGVKHILTAEILIERIALQGINLSAIGERFVFVEDISSKISRFSKLRAFLASHITWHSLSKVKEPETAVVIFTSGSETLPKAVPLTAANLLANMREVLDVVKIYENDRLIGFLPPFHSFGLTVTMLLPLCGSAQIVYHPNPTEADTLAKLIETYGVTMLVGTPTFLAGIVRAANPSQLTTLRLVVTGAERCPEKVYEALKTKCAGAIVLEGYGVTECSPIISINDPDKPEPFSIGKVLPGLDYIVVDPDSLEPRTPPCSGVLLVRGPSVFGGYLNYKGKSPFVEVNGKRWYNTGDLVSIDAEGLLTFQGRLKRFVKLGGEMVSLPAIEAVLQSLFASEDNEGPVLAVEAADAENPELVLFTILDIDRETANRKIRSAGLSALHSIRRVIKLDEMPLLGNGKTNYRALKQLLK